MLDFLYVCMCVCMCGTLQLIMTYVYRKRTESNETSKRENVQKLLYFTFYFDFYSLVRKLVTDK